MNVRDYVIVIGSGTYHRPVVAMVSSLQDCPEGSFRWSIRGTSGTCAFADEGATWIRWDRGHDNVEGVRALEVAYALRADGTRSIRFDDNTPTVALRGRSFALVDGRLPALPCGIAPDDIFCLVIP